MKLLFSSTAIMASISLFATSGSAALATADLDGGNMNPLPYTIANSDTYPTDFNEAEYFEVYTPLIRTRYSEVFWKTQEPVPLPDEIVKRFENRTMAVVGFEVDQVYQERDANGRDISVPISYAFNHHFNAWILNARKASIFQKTKRDNQNETGMPLVQAFTHGNGGEFRGSYRGYPKGYAQLIDSPDTFRATVMAIDTWNREAMVNNVPKFVQGPLPKFSQTRFNATDLVVSPLVECPCNDETDKEGGGMSYALADTAVCTTPVESTAECQAAVSKLVQTRQPIVMHIVKAPYDRFFRVPQGCSIEHQSDGTTHGYWKGHDNSSLALETDRDLDSTIDVPSDHLIAMTASHQVNVTVEINAMSDMAKITLTGPADRWLAVAFGSHSMCLRLRSDLCLDGGPYAIIVSGHDVMERVLDYHGAGRLIETSVVVESNVVVEGFRTVTLTRSLKGQTDDHYSFDFAELATVPSHLPIIVAHGCSLEFAQHCGHGRATLNFLPVENGKDRHQLTHICRNGVAGAINGDDFQVGSQPRCADFPRSDLSNQHNPTCAIDTYVGGLMCCRHGHSLLDSNQGQPWEDQYLEYHLKFRFYFEEYSNETSSAASAFRSEDSSEAIATSNSKPSHENLLNFPWMTESNAQEYDTPVCPKGTHPSQCLHVITSHFHVSDMIRDCPTRPDASYCTGTNASQAKGIKLIYVSAHCHVGICHSMELYNADTGRLICQVQPIVGQSDTEIFNERGHIALPPCLFSDNTESAEGLWLPEFLPMNTTLFSIKRVNTTYAHTGEMAMWQMRGVLVPQDPGNSSQRVEPDSAPGNSSDYVEPDSYSEGDDVIDDADNAPIATFLFGAWFIACFYSAMLLWGLAFQKRTPEPYLLGEFTDLVLFEEDSHLMV